MAKKEEILNSAGVLVIQENATIKEGIDRMVIANVGSIIVLRDEEVVGIVTERDVLKNWSKLGSQGFLKQNISQVMSSPVHCLLSSELYRAAMVMTEKKIRHIPILGKEKKLIGVMSMRDVLKNYNLYARPQDDIPHSNPISPLEAKNKVTCHLINPTHGVGTLLKEIYERQIQFRDWGSLQDFANSEDFKTNGDRPIFIDLDNIQKPVWFAVIKQLVANLKNSRPQLFIFLTAESYGFEETDQLRAISQKVNWHVYSRPISIAALTHDLSKIKLE